MSEADVVAKPVEAVEPQATEATEAAPEANIIKTTAQIDCKNHKNNRKFDPSTQEVTDDPVAIRKQVEFYFGDWNFAQDKFMWETCGGSENKPMAIEKIHTFKRMRRFQPYTAVVAALRDSELLDVEGGEGKETVRRKVAYKPMNNTRSKAEAATVYVKGFGDETPSTQFDLETFFAQYGEVKGLKLRRTGENLFKGSVFVTFADEETASKFIKLEPAPKWKEHDLKIMTKHDYCEEKSEMIRQGKLEPSSTSSKKFYEGRESGSRGGNKNAGGKDANDWKKRRDNDQKNGFRGGRGGRGGRGRGGRGGRGGNFRGGDRDAKRPREEDGAAGEPAAKKVDNKEAAPASE